MPELAHTTPNEDDKALYLAVLRAGQVPLREVTEQDAAATARLLALGLLVHSEVNDWVVAVNPRTAGARLSAALRESAGDLLARAERTASGMDTLAESYAVARRRSDSAARITHLTSLEQIQQRLLAVEAEYREEALIAQPGERPSYVHTNDRVRKSLGEGAAIDILYQPVARQTPHTAAYAADATGWGMRLRVLDEPFARMMIFDRRVAIISTATANVTAAFIEDPAVVDHLVGVFLRDWERAVRVPWFDQVGRELPEVLCRVGELLAAGLTQKAVASRLALSERTVAAHIARLRERYDAETLFQLGWLMRDGGRHA
ncbi:LuxR C-terminal-related transcriptional regulator [Kitasatospora sp. NPDC057198]|uniref:LuxR C-terminal-related transcriptional regulator n=1 Tax=Kitasatospora sp. NPDC057198 TaxID=3346046 RepID=UPI003636EFC9